MDSRATRAVGGSIDTAPRGINYRRLSLCYRTKIISSEKTGAMKRGALFKTVAAFGVVMAIPFVAADELSAWPVSAGGQDDSEGKKSATTNPLTPPASGLIPVAFGLSKETVVIDFAGPREVFQKAKVSARSRPFRPCTVAENNKAMDVQFGGMKSCRNRPSITLQRQRSSSYRHRMEVNTPCWTGSASLRKTRT